MSQSLTAALPVEFGMDAAIWITVVATVAGIAFMAFMVYLALGPEFSSTEVLDSAAEGEPALEAQETD